MQTFAHGPSVLFEYLRTVIKTIGGAGCEEIWKLR